MLFHNQNFEEKKERIFESKILKNFILKHDEIVLKDKNLRYSKFLR